VLDVAVTKRLDAFSIDAAFVGGRGVTALFGVSGAGKTSVIQILAGLLRPDGGHVKINERILFDSSRNINLPPEKRRLGYVFQDARLFPHMNIERNLTYGARDPDRRSKGIAISDVVSVLGLEGMLKRKPTTLSGGERQRVAIGRALLADPELLLMDEPLASLDAGRRSEIMTFIEMVQVTFSIPIIYVSHNMDEVVRLADDLVVLDNGRVRAAGPIEDVTTDLANAQMSEAAELGAVMKVHVVGHDDVDRLTKLKTGGVELWLPRLSANVGDDIRIRIRARDVSITLSPPSDTSILNVLPARILEIADSGDAQKDILLDFGSRLIARVTSRSARQLALAPGQEVFAQIKSVSVDRTGRAEPPTVLR
jgi:molybdate transport system ATP-binding protein